VQHNFSKKHCEEFLRNSSSSLLQDASSDDVTVKRPYTKRPQEESRSPSITGKKPKINKFSVSSEIQKHDNDYVTVQDSPPCVNLPLQQNIDHIAPGCLPLTTTCGLKGANHMNTGEDKQFSVDSNNNSRASEAQALSMEITLDYPLAITEGQPKDRPLKSPNKGSKKVSLTAEDLENIFTSIGDSLDSLTKLHRRLGEVVRLVTRSGPYSVSPLKHFVFLKRFINKRYFLTGSKGKMKCLRQNYATGEGCMGEALTVFNQVMAGAPMLKEAPQYCCIAFFFNTKQGSRGINRQLLAKISCKSCLLI
jgi:hypothetical protein